MERESIAFEEGGLFMAFVVNFSSREEKRER
jgi:hypothetical protein